MVVVEGESDCHTLWYAGIPALGLPGAGTWRQDWAAYLDGIATVYVVQEPDEAGAGLVKRLSETPSLRDRLRVVRLPDGLKDPSAIWLSLPDDLDDEARKAAFKQQIEAALGAAVPAAELEARAAMEAAAQELVKAGPLATCPNILDEVVRACASLGLVGEERAAKLLYLVLTTRLLDRPVSAKIAGPAASGKSFSAEVVLKLLPPEAYHELSAMSEHGLVYETEPLQHRFLVLFEAAGLSSEFTTYAVRSLLSEGRLRYLTVEKAADGLKPRLVEREGPTGLLVTTTRVSLDQELETRLFTIPSDDSPEQTRRVLKEQARRAKGEVPTVDLEPWHALQRWLASQPVEVVVPFADAVAELANPAAIRLRRDFQAVLSLVKAHALLHQATRPRDERGRIVATLDDYRAVHGLVADLLRHSAQTDVPQAVREAVEVVQQIYEQTEDPVTVTQVAKRLGIDKAAASRRIRQAVEAGWLVNLEDRRGYPARLVPGDALPDGRPILPDPDAVAQDTGNEAERAADAGVCACSIPRINGSTPPAPMPENRATTAIEPLTRQDQHPVNTLNGSRGTGAVATHGGVDPVDGVLTTTDQRFEGRNDGLFNQSAATVDTVDRGGPAHARRRGRGIVLG
ncbi:MAG TPA: MarR family transcriptional regulator [Bacillota bacterium]